jgi:Flp pilus assembly protein TadG
MVERAAARAGSDVHARDEQLRERSRGRRMTRSRGQAIIETALFLPLALLTLFAVIWASQYAVMSERVQSAVRYSGLVSNQLNPYTQYSFYVLYNSLGAMSSNSPIPVQTCNNPTTDALTNSGSYPGPSSAPFWLATPAAPTVSCSSAPAVFNVGMNQTSLGLSNTPVVQAAAIVPAYLANAMKFGAVIPNGTLPADATLNFIKPADMRTLMTCHPGFQSTIASSLAPPPATMNPSTTPAALPQPLPSPTVIPEYGC